MNGHHVITTLILRFPFICIYCIEFVSDGKLDYTDSFFSVEFSRGMVVI
jgi:hypothetical protein